MSIVGEFVWYDHWTNDLKAAEEFYTRAIGWNTQRFGEGPDAYVMWAVGDTAIGGIGKVPREADGRAGHPLWVAFVAVDDVDATAERALRLGGGIRTPGTDIPGVGRFAVIQDPQGAVIALHSSIQEGSTVPADRVKPGFVCWHELYTTDHEAAWRFYSELFGWKHTSSMDMGADGPYFMFRHADAAEQAPFGAMFNGARTLDVPPHWLYYVSVEGLEGTLGRVRDAGGEVCEGPMDVPGGRIAPCRDPQGGAFAVFSHEPPRVP